MTAPPWRATASRCALELRAGILARVRTYFAAQGVMEVATPALSRAATTEPNLESLSVSVAGERRYLHTSPEAAMKRLLAGGSGDIYQVCPVFRAHELGRVHNPEFTMLEWYRVGFDAAALMDEVEALLSHALAGLVEAAPTERTSYRAAFRAHAGLDPLRADIGRCAACAAAHGIDARASLALDPWLDLLMSEVVAPRFPADRFTFVYDYPATQAALAALSPTDPRVAERFEVFWGALELVNGAHELADARAQRRRFDDELARRRAAGLSEPPSDERLLAALEAGLPDCAGAALGVDRLAMLASGARELAEVLAFPWPRA